MSLPITIIVPIYQSEQTLRRCIDSILAQTFTDFELLLVNDGSTDKSFQICEEYAQKDGRIRVFNKEHSGVSDTRQIGLENSLGEYVIHSDSDDRMDPNMLDTLYRKAKEKDADMVVCDYISDTGDEKKVVSEFPYGLDSYKKISEQVRYLSYNVWDKLIRRSLFERYNISFPKGVLCGEDMYVILQLLNHNITIYHIKSPLYTYYQNENSLFRQAKADILNSNIEVINDISRIIDDSLLHLLNPSKVFVVTSLYNRQLMSIESLRKLYPEVHSIIALSSIKHIRLLPMSFSLCNYNVIKFISRVCSGIKYKLRFS